MANLSLRSRRFLARGISSRLGRAWAGRVFLSPGVGDRAALTTALAGANNDLYVYAKQPGTGGNSISLTIAVAGNNTPLSVTVAGKDITVNAATNGSGAPTSTAADVVRAINFNPAAAPLVWAQTAPGNDGKGVVAALAKTSLAGAA